MDGTGRPGSASSGRQGRATPPRPTPSRRAAQKKRRQQSILIGVCAAAAIILIILIIVLFSLLNKPEEDDGLILDNVFAAGVNLGGMTPEQAKAELKAQTDDTYSVLDMTVSILDNTYTLSPADTRAKLDIDAVVNAAYNYGRTGSSSEQQRAREEAQSSSYTVSILPYLNLDTDYIHSVINDLGQQFSTILKQTTYELDSTRPSLTQEEYDTSIVYQTLTVHVGTAEYSLSTDTLYEQIMDAYEINLFHVTAQCSMIAPAELDYEAVYDAVGCVAPVNAEFDPETYEVTPHIYGYGFTLEELKTKVDAAEYGEDVVIELRFIEPEITDDFYTEDMFQDVLGIFSTVLPTDSAWVTNVTLACGKLNGTIIKAGDEFSFNKVIGEPTAKQGYQTATVYLGKASTAMLGGGICQAASTLYYCALLSDLEILERNSHGYAVSYIQAGFDAEVLYGSLDLRFTNTTGNAIRIDAQVINGELVIILMGSDTREYTVELNYIIDQIYEPETVYNTMLEFNVGGYVQGDILSEGITGYKISTYIVRTPKAAGEIEEALVATTYYAKRDQVIVSIYEPPVDTDPTDPVDPTAPSDPSDPTQDPTDTTSPDETTTPTESTDIPE